MASIQLGQEVDDEGRIRISWKRLGDEGVSIV